MTNISLKSLFNSAHGKDLLPVGISVNIRAILKYTGKFQTWLDSP